MATRRGRWYPPPPPTPRILHLPRRIRRKPTKNLSPKLGFLNNKQSSTRGHNNDHRGKLETLFDQERAFSKTVPIVLLSSSEDLERRERVEEGFDFHDEEEEKWKFQAEILRAECNFLRMEREIALKKLEMNQVQTKKTLRFAVETLNSDKKKKIYEGEIEDLEEKLDELQRKSGVTDIEIKKCTNFDKKASVLQKKLESLKFEEKSFVQEIQQEALASLNIKTSRFNNPKIIKQDQTSRFIDVEILGKKMEGISKGMLERMEEEYRSMLSSCSSSLTTSGTSSASTSSRFEFLNSSSSSSSSSSIKHQQNQNQERMLHEQQQVCTGRCKAIVRKIVEQVRSEMEQWSQMQDMLKRVKEEMEELQASRDFWEDRALNSDIQAKSLQSAMQEWKDKALSSDKRVSELEKEMSDLHMELTKSKTESNMDASRTRSLGMVQWDRPSQKEKEKRVLICENLKEKKRLPDAKQNKICYETIRMRERTYHNGGVTDSNGSPLPLQEIENSASSQRFRQMDIAVQSSPLYNDENQVNLASCHKQNKHHEEVHKTRVCTTRSGIIGSNRPPLQEIENLSSSPRLRQINRVVQSSSSHRYEKPMISIRSKESDSRNDIVGSNRSPLQGLEKSYWPKYLHKNREVSSPYD